MALTPPPGLRRPRTDAPRTHATGTSTSGRGLGGIPRRKRRRRVARASPDRSCAGRASWSRAAGCPNQPRHRSRWGAGGSSLARMRGSRSPTSTSTVPGGLTSAAATARLPSASASRFRKPSLHGTLPRGRHPEQADRWTWRVALADTPLRWARPRVADQRLPGERPRAPERRTPGRVRRGFGRLLLPSAARGHARKGAQTRWALSWPPQRHALWPRATPSRAYQRALHPCQRRLTLRSLGHSFTRRRLPQLAVRLVLLKSQA